jgi:hypothetical protein
MSSVPGLSISRRLDELCLVITLNYLLLLDQLPETVCIRRCSDGISKTPAAWVPAGVVQMSQLRITPPHPDPPADASHL